MNKSIAIQDVFLNQVRKSHMMVTVHLLNGFQIRGVVKGFDSFVVVLVSEGKQMMIYKHAVSTITPAQPVVYHSDEEGNVLADIDDDML